MGKEIGYRLMGKIELLSPAGDMERLKMSVLYGADSVYLAGTDFGMRSFAGNFSPEELPKAVEFAHSHGVSVHVTVNTMPRNDEVVNLPAYLERLQDAGVDALIIADMGAFMLAGKYAPKCQRHISTQVTLHCYAYAWHTAGYAVADRLWRRCCGRRCGVFQTSCCGVAGCGHCS